MTSRKSTNSTKRTTKSGKRLSLKKQTLKDLNPRTSGPHGGRPPARGSLPTFCEGCA